MIHKLGPTHRLVLEIAVPDFYVDKDDVENINEYAEGDVLFVVTEEWIRSEVGLTFMTRPGEKMMNDDFEVICRTCEIVGARLEPLK